MNAMILSDMTVRLIHGGGEAEFIASQANKGK
jgi:hypothetical protein